MQAHVCRMPCSPVHDLTIAATFVRDCIPVAAPVTAWICPDASPCLPHAVLSGPRSYDRGYICARLHPRSRAGNGVDLSACRSLSAAEVSELRSKALSTRTGDDRIRVGHLKPALLQVITVVQLRTRHEEGTFRVDHHAHLV